MVEEFPGDYGSALWLAWATDQASVEGNMQLAVSAVEQSIPLAMRLGNVLNGISEALELPILHSTGILHC